MGISLFKGGKVMLNHIRAATPEEVERIRKGSDLGGGSVLALDHQKGQTSLAVLRTVLEVDPVYYAEGLPAKHKALFIWGLEERLIGANVGHYFFNVGAEDEAYAKIVKEWGAVQQSKGPELRFGRSLVHVDSKD
jgi:hypothetical protein